MSYSLSPQVVVPAADQDGCWHYTYVTYHPETGEWYGGKHSTDNLDDGYLGSGRWIDKHPARAELLVEVIQFFPSEAAAYVAEEALVTWTVIDTDPLCRNEMPGGLGCTREAAKRLIAKLVADPHWQRKNREAVARTTADPEWRRKNRETNIRLAADQDFKRKHRQGCIKRSADLEWQQRAVKQLLAGRARRQADPARREENRKRQAALMANPETRRKLSEAVAKRYADDPCYRQLVADRTRQAMADPEIQQRYRAGIIRRTEAYHAKKAGGG